MSVEASAKGSPLFLVNAIVHTRLFGEDIVSVVIVYQRSRQTPSYC